MDNGATTEAVPTRHEVDHKPMDGVEWLTWEAHRRTENIAGYFGIPVTVVSSRFKGVVRYLHASCETLRYLLGRRPRVLIVQNPSLVLTALAVLLRPLFRYRLVVDAHNEAVQPFINSHYLVVRLSRWLLRKADITVVTNQSLAKIVWDTGGVAVVLPDRLPEMRSSARVHRGMKDKAVLVATFAKDEPIIEVLEAHANVRADIDLLVTGRIDNLSTDVWRKYRDFVKFTDFLAQEEYEALLAEADFIIDLTLMDNCLVCGAYEAISLCKPVILSDNRATRDYFYKGAVYVDNTISGLVEGMRNMIAHRHRLSEEAETLREELAKSWVSTAENLRFVLMEGRLDRPTSPLRE